MDNTKNIQLEFGDWFRTCRKCGSSKPLAEYEMPQFKKHGYCMTCRECRKPITDEERFWQKVDRSGDKCWEWQSCRLFKGDYGAFRLHGKSLRAHRVAWELTNGPIPTGMELCHICDNPRCVRPNHLFLGTHAENMRDKVEKGRCRPAKGENSWSAKLSARDVARIRRRYATGKVSQSEIGEEYDIHPTQISRIINGRSWNDSYKGEPIPIRPIVNKGTRQKKSETNPIVLCACGCQKELLRYDKYGRSRKYISGHNNQARKCAASG